MNFYNLFQTINPEAQQSNKIKATLQQLEPVMMKSVTPVKHKTPSYTVIQDDSCPFGHKLPVANVNTKRNTTENPKVQVHVKRKQTTTAKDAKQEPKKGYQESKTVQSS